jgi:galactitol-specific phosphotransferase system IIB component
VISGDEVMKKLVIAGGSCGNSMLRSAAKIKKACLQNNIKVVVNIHNLWESIEIDSRANLVIQMFPFFDQLNCPLLDGRPFITGNGEVDLIEKILTILKDNTDEYLA